MTDPPTFTVRIPAEREITEAQRAELKELGVEIVGGTSTHRTHAGYAGEETPMRTILRHVPAPSSEPARGIVRDILGASREEAETWDVHPES